MATIKDLTDGQLAEYMGQGATEYEASRMRTYLLEAEYIDTAEVPDDTWVLFCAWALRDAQAVEGN